MDVRLNLLDKNNKIIIKETLAPFDWCGLFGKNGKVPTVIGWKVVMKGFGKYFKDYMNCPIKKNVTLNRIHADPKMLLFAQNGKAKFQLLANVTGDKGQKEFANISLIIEIFDV
jgi:hypothetical protein